jgi:hypothetical protein
MSLVGFYPNLNSTTAGSHPFKKRPTTLSQDGENDIEQALDLPLTDSKNPVKIF